MDAPQGRHVHVCQRHTHDGDGNKACLMLDLIGQDEDHDHRCQQHRDLQEFRDGAAREGPCDRRRSHITDYAGKDCCEDQRRDDFEQARARRRGDCPEIFIGDNREQSADRIVDNSFPLEDRCRSRFHR